MNILIFSYYLYPGTAVGGMRAHMLASGLAARGHSVQVVTAEQAVVSDHGYARSISPDSSLATRWDKLVQVPDVRRRWVEGAFSLAMAQGMFERADVLITSGGPFSTHMVGLRARDAGWAGVWIAEYRDLWTSSPYYALGPLRRLLDRKIERRILAAADVVVAATESMAHEIRRFRPSGVVAVYSAVASPPDELDVGEQFGPRRDGRLRIAHAGYLYKGRRDVRPLLRAVSAVRDSGQVGADELEVHFFGPRDKNLSRTVASLSLQECVAVHGELPRDELWRELALMDVLAVIRWQSPADAPFIPGKLYEYMAFGVPILLTNAVAGGEAENLVSQLGCGAACSTAEEIQRVVVDLVEQKRLTGDVRCQHAGDLDRFSPEHFIDAYAGVIDAAFAARTA